MWATSVVLFFALTSSLEAGQLRSCVEEDVCQSILFNQLSIAALNDDLKEVALSLNITRNPHDFVPKGELDTCFSQKNFLKKQVASLQNKIPYNDQQSGGLVIEDVRGPKLEERDPQLEELRTAVETLRTSLEDFRRSEEDLMRSKENLETENRRLQQVIVQKDDHIKNLTYFSSMPVDCADIQVQGHTESGVYTLYPYGPEESIDAFCDLESNGGGWTVFIARQPQDEPLNFNDSWENFKNGFGNINTEHWLGTEFIHVLTSHGNSSLRLDAEIYSGERRWAEWTTFAVGDEESKYQLTLEDYEVTSTMGDSFSRNGNSSFTTFDSDNDQRIDLNCALGTTYANWGKGGWWYKGCGNARPTAPLKNSNSWDSACWLNWDTEGKSLVSFKSLSMKFRRHNYEELSMF